MHCRICRSPSYSDPCLPCKVKAKEAKELSQASRVLPEQSAGYDSDLYRSLKILFEHLHNKAARLPGYEMTEWQNLNLGIHTVIGKGIMAATPDSLRLTVQAITRPAPPATRPHQEPIKVAPTEIHQPEVVPPQEQPPQVTE